MFTTRSTNQTRDQKTVHARTPKLRAVGRRGVVLVIVLLTLGTSLVLTFALLRSQTTTLLLHANTMHRDWALEAAHAGAAVAVAQMQADDWAGVADIVTGVMHVDTAGTASYTVEYLEYDEAAATMWPAVGALHVKIHSTGRWESAGDAANFVEREVEVIARLRPRLPGRPIVAGDSSDADDLIANFGDYDLIQDYTMYADNTGASLTLDPCGRIDGDVWLNDNLNLYKDPDWSATVRSEMLSSIGTRDVDGSGIHHPHPIAGAVTFYQAPESSVQTDLAQLGVNWSQTPTALNFPNVHFPKWATYTLYEGGFEYTAQVVGSWLQDTELRPSSDNPLGIFYRSGSMTLADDVVIQGTLVCTGQVTIDGDFVHLASVNWTEDDGSAAFENHGLWPRLPAIVAERVFVKRGTQTHIDGAITLDKTFEGAGGNLDFMSGNNVSITGTAISTPIQQPYCEVELQESVDLSGIDATGTYAIWLADGNSGSWHAIVGVDSANLLLTVVGSIDQSSPTDYQIIRNRLRYTDINGPISGEKVDVFRTSNWVLTTTLWDWLHDLWGVVNDDRAGQGLPLILFVDWLEDSSNFSGWGVPYTDIGMPLEPTFHARNSSGANFQWEPPLYESFSGSGPTEEFSGYRWEVVNWRELP